MTVTQTHHPRYRARIASPFIALLTMLASVGALSVAAARPADAIPNSLALTQKIDQRTRPAIANPSTWGLAPKNLKPQYQDHSCFFTRVYIDFVDPDGPDAFLSAEIKVHRGSTVYTRPMLKSYNDEGLTFYIDLHGATPIPVHSIERFSIRAGDGMAWSDPVNLAYTDGQQESCS